MAAHSSILAQRIPRTEEPGGLQSTGSQRVGHNRATNIHTFTYAHHIQIHIRWFNPRMRQYLNDAQRRAKYPSDTVSRDFCVGNRNSDLLVALVFTFQGGA